MCRWFDLNTTFVSVVTVSTAIAFTIAMSDLLRLELCHEHYESIAVGSCCGGSNFVNETTLRATPTADDHSGCLLSILGGKYGSRCIWHF